ncbi:MAG: phytoene desaturase family protein [Pirellulales bacterium]
MSARVVIVGAGPGGLASAMLLAAAGVEVDILEKAPQVGGRTAALEADGFRFDLGPTFFLYPRVLEEIFAAAGYRLRDEVPMMRLDPQYRLIFGGGGQLDATNDVPRMVEAVAAISPADAAQVPRFLAANREKFARFRPILERACQSWRDLLTPASVGLLPLLAPWRSLDGELRRYFRDPRVRLAFTFQSKYLGMSPLKCPSLFSILSFLEYEYGVWHPLGGCSQVTETMARLARRLGVRIHVDEPVKEILFAGRRAIGVRTAADDYLADALVINADFARAMTRLVPNRLRRRWSDEQIDRKRFSCSTFMMYLGLEGSQEQLAHHTVYLAEDYRRNLSDIEERHALSEDPSFYVQNACVTDPGLAAPGHSTLYVLVPVTHQHPHVDWAREGPRFRQRVLRQLRHIGLDDVERRIRFERVITPADWERDFEIYRGATFNLAHTFGQMLHLRPRNRFDELDAVYLVGGGTHPGSGLPVIFESARISAGLLLDDLGIARPSGSLTRRHLEPALVNYELAQQATADVLEPVAQLTELSSG